MKGSKINSYEKLFQRRLFLQYIGIMNKPSVWALINEKHKRVYIGASKEPLSALMSLLGQLYSKHRTKMPLLKEDRKWCLFKILETTNELRVSKWEWMDKYIKMGYSLYNIETLPKYTVRLQINIHKKLIYVQLVSGGGRVKTVGEFKTEDEANEFIAANSIFSMMRLQCLR